MILAVMLGDWSVVDTCDAAAHRAALIELRKLVAVGPKPGAGVVIPFTGNADRDTIFVVPPKLVDEATGDH